MYKKITEYFHLNKLGWFEFLFAMYPILAGYQYGSLPFNLLILLILDIWAIRKGAEPAKIKLLSIITLFILGHEIIVLLINDLDGTHINSIISTTVFLLSIFIILPAINYEKLVGALYVVGLISSIGIIYHVMLILSGNTVSPITLPFLPPLPSNSRAFEDALRPRSFFWEPAAYVTFMMVPLFIALIERKMLMVFFFFFTMVLSTSTNGIVLGALMITIAVLIGNYRLKYKFVLAAFLLATSYLFMTSPIFESGLDKIENTDAETNVRLSSGPNLVFNMPTEHILLGIPVHDVNEYYAAGNVKNARFGSEIFLPTFWNVLVTYGIIGVVLHMSLYVFVIYKCRKLLPYMIVLIVSQFVQSVGFNSIYVYQFLFIFSFIVYDRYQKCHDKVLVKEILDNQ